VKLRKVDQLYPKGFRTGFGFNEAAAVKLRKAKAAAIRLAKKALLQRSRSGEAAEGCSNGTLPPVHGCFNEAAAVKLRKDRLQRLRSPDNDQASTKPQR